MDEQRCDPVVLLIDDDELERFLYRQALEQEGFETVEAEDGAAALEAFALAAPDIIILDVIMPKIDGFAACQAIRALPAGRNIPILMATGLEDVESIDKAYRVGATDFITKPVSYPLLPHRLRYMLRAHRLAEAQRIAGLAHLRWVPKSRLIDCSPDLSRMFGLSAKATRHPARDLLRRVLSSDRARIIRAVRDALQGTTIGLNHRIVAPDGEVRTLSLRAEGVKGENGPRYLQGSYIDITEHERIEAQLQVARDEARSASAAKTAFLAGMSHELHTPLNAILGFSELIANEAVGPISQRDYIEFARTIHSAGQRALAVFLDVMMMAELEAERFKLEFENVDMSAAVKAAVAEFARSESGLGRSIELEMRQDVPVICADPRAVNQILLKLLSNAAKFSAADTTIRVTITRAGDGSPRVSIVDTGIGMTAEQTRLAVRPFGQADGRLARDYNGLGLGLSIVSKLVERQGGRLTIASTPQQGTHVSVDFPVPRPQERMGLLLYSQPLRTDSTRVVDAFLTEPRVAKA